MKKLLFCVYFLVIFISLAGCAALKKIAHPSLKPDNSAKINILPFYSGLKARVVVANFDIKAAKATQDIGSGLREMLVAALLNSGRFSIDTNTSSVVMPQKEKAKAADLVISAMVAEFEPETSGGKAGIGGGGGAGSGILGGLLGETLNKARIVLDIRVIDSSTSESLAVSRVQGQASDASKASMGGVSGGLGLAEGLSIYANTPMGKAVHICVIEAARYISKTVPEVYYKYN